MNERDVIQQLGVPYGRCRSYEDQGLVENIIDPGTSNERRERIQFRTAFRRPLFFRFEWRILDRITGVAGDVEMIWCDGIKSFSKNRFEEQPIECDSLDHAIAGATSVAAHTVSALLMPGVLTFSFMRHGALSSMPEENFGGEQCYHVVANTEEQRTDILVGKAKFVLRRIREERVMKGGAHNVNLPELPPGIGTAEHEEMMRILAESAEEDLHTISDCTYSHVRFDGEIPETIFKVLGTPT
ncbi:MAG TPA: hypothetical protein V6C81_09195 [Planktothrix sp.]|jgi:hypothetical protein